MDDTIQETTLRDVIFLVARSKLNKDLSQKYLADLLDQQPSNLSAILSGSRSFTRRFAGQLSDKIGGKVETWLNISDSISKGTLLPPSHFRDLILSDHEAVGSIGSYFKRLVDEDILNLFGQRTELSEDIVPGEGGCYIKGFSEKNVNTTSYDATAELGGDKSKVIRAGKAVQLSTHEYFCIPNWMEVEVHPPTSLAKKGLIISNGPIIDPGWRGHLWVLVFNPTEAPVSVEASEAFMTLRFSVRT